MRFFLKVKTGPKPVLGSLVFPRLDPFGSALEAQFGRLKPNGRGTGRFGRRRGGKRVTFVASNALVTSSDALLLVASRGSPCECNECHSSGFSRPKHIKTRCRICGSCRNAFRRKT